MAPTPASEMAQTSDHAGNPFVTAPLDVKLPTMRNLDEVLMMRLVRTIV